MKVCMVMFDTLCRHFLSPYGNSWIKTPNFERLAKKTVQFENCYVGSMPCMPARREIHTGRYNFLHRSWGPLEPFDHSMPEILKNSGIHTHKVTDHQHYWEDGGATYHNRYSTYEFVRGQEGDLWRGYLGDIDDSNQLIGFDGNVLRKQDWINRQWLNSDSVMPQYVTFSKGLKFIEENHQFDNWFLQIETFDPHEPFFTQKYWQDLYPHDYVGKFFDWPPYTKINQDEKTINHIRYMFASLVTFCDFNLGRVLDKMDEYDLWNDTLLIVNTDHGYLMGEHDWWAKSIQPFYQEIAHIPLWIWNPLTKIINVKRHSLVQTIDLAPTILDFFGLKIPDEVQGHSLLATVNSDQAIREYGLFGIHGGHVNITDGNYVYMRGANTPQNTPLYEYTLMPTHMRSMFSVAELYNWEKHQGFNFSQGVPLMKIPARLLNQTTTYANPDSWQGNFLYDVKNDPQQKNVINNIKLEQKLIKEMIKLMQLNDAPQEQYQRLGLDL
jgi:arylsulfatase A-like enzyme